MTTSPTFESKHCRPRLLLQQKKPRYPSATGEMGRRNQRYSKDSNANGTTRLRKKMRRDPSGIRTNTKKSGTNVVCGIGTRGSKGSNISHSPSVDDQEEKGSIIFASGVGGIVSPSKEFVVMLNCDTKVDLPKLSPKQPLQSRFSIPIKNRFL